MADPITAPPPAVISWQRLNTPRNALRWQQLQAYARCLVATDTVCSNVQRLLVISRDEFKQLSHYGAVYMGKGQYEDAGNWTYSAIWLLIWRWSGGKDLERSLMELGDRYPTLRPDAAYTQNSLSMQGDAVEAILYDCRFTGPAVDAAVARARNATNNYIKRMWSLISELHRHASGYERTADSDWPSPEEFLCIRPQ